MSENKSIRRVGLVVGLAAGAFVVLMVLALLALVVLRQDNVGSGVRCARNLRTIGQGILLYANDNRGQYPRGRYDPEAPGRLTAYTAPESRDMFSSQGPGPNDLTAGLFLLVKAADLPPEIFVCPNSSETPLKSKRPLTEVSNFPSRRNLSYSFANAYPAPANGPRGYQLNSGVSATFALAADMNPGGAAVTAITPTSPARVFRAANSHNHGQEGQNVLFNDGHMEWCVSVLVGDNGDNIFSRAKPTSGDPIVGPPTHPMDSVLLPTAEMGPR